MEKIQCPECGRIKGENDEHCLDCGYVFEKTKNEIKKEVEVKEEKKEVKKETNTKQNNFNLDYVVVALTFIYIIGLLKLPMVISKNSGNLPLFEFVKQYTSIRYMYSLYKYGSIAVVGILFINIVFLFINQKTRIISKIAYLLTFIFEILLIIIIYSINYEVLVLNTIIIFIIPLAMFILTKKKKKDIKSNNDYIKKIKELKDLYDSETISKEEFEKYKKELLDKEMK